MTHEQSPALLVTRMEDCTSLGQHERHPEFPVVTRESHRNSRKKHEVPQSSQDEALSRYSISREVLRSILTFKMVLDTFDATQKFPRDPGLIREEH